MQTNAPRIQTTSWRIDPDRSSVEFTTRFMWGIMAVTGRFSRYHGTLDLSEDPAIELTVEAASIGTGNRRRDEHLRSPDFFAAEQHPYVRFASERAELDGERLRIHGRLHARGAGIPLEVDAAVRRAGDDELEIEAVTSVDHRRLGMEWNVLGMIATPSTLTVRGRLVSSSSA